MPTITALLLVLLLPAGAFAGSLLIMTEQGRPLHYTEDETATGRIVGPVAEVVREIQRRAGDDSPIRMLPWARGYKTLQSRTGAMLFTMARLPSREGLFQWVGPVAESEYVFYARKDSGVRLDGLDQARKVAGICVYRDDAREIHLRERGFTNLDVADNPLQCLKKLMAGRDVLWAYGTTGLASKAQEAGVDPDLLEPVLTFHKVSLYCAFSPTTPRATVTTWQKALDAMKADGTFAAIFERWAER